MRNPFWHLELHSNDLGKSEEFYTKLFDWKLEDMPDGEHSYTMIRVGEGTDGEMMRAPMPIYRKNRFHRSWDAETSQSGESRLLWTLFTR